jgi:hypothetical protein
MLLLAQWVLLWRVFCATTYASYEEMGTTV